MEFILMKKNKLVDAISSQDWAAVRMICKDEKRLINTHDQYGDTPLMRAANYGAPEDVMLRMIDVATEENLEYANNVGFTILHYLADYADAPAAVAAMRRVFQRTSKHINKRDGDGQTPLHYCLDAEYNEDRSYEDQREAALCLMTHGASGTIKDNKGKTPLDYYDDNECEGYEDATRQKQKKELRDLLEGLVPPREVLARGPEAANAFFAAIQEGSKCVNETRLMLVGPERVGKTSLTKALTEQEFDATEEVTDGIETFTLSVNHITNWKLKPKPAEGKVSEARQQYSKAVAERIAAKLLLKKHEKQPESETIPPMVVTDHTTNSMKDKIKKLQSGEHTKDITKPRNATPDAPEQSHDQATTSQGVGLMQIPVDWLDDLMTVEGVGPMQIPEDELLDDLMTVEDSVTSVVELDAPMGASSQEDSASSQEDSASPTKQNVPEDVVQHVLEILQKKEIRGENEGIEETVDDLTLSIWDFAGQDLYYITHLVFLVSRAIYIICFNLCHDLNAPAKVEIYKRELGKTSVFHHMTNLDFIVFWLRSIYSNTTENPSSNQEQLSPPVFIVGTHFLSLPGNAQEKLALAKEKFAVIQKKLRGTPYEAHVVTKYYAIDNSLRSPLDQSIVDLREHINKVAKQQHYMGQRIPIKWLEFLHKIEQLCNKQKNAINFKEVKDLAAKCDIIDEMQLFTLLHFYHDLGNIVYYGERDKPDSALNDIIILNANWLISIFRRVFTVKGQSERWAKFQSSWTRLDEEGLMEEKLVRHMLHDFLDILESLLELMEKFDLLCVKTQFAEMPTHVGLPEEGNRFFYVPSLLKTEGDNMVSMDHLVKSKSVVMLYIDFNGFLPEGLFYRLVVRLVQWSQSKGGEPRLFYQQAILYVDEEHNMILRILPQKRSFIQVAIMRASYVGGDEVEPCPDICKMVLTFLDKNLLDLGHTWMKRIDFGFSILCSVCDNKKMTHFHELKKCLEKKLVQCGMERMQTIRFQRLFGNCKAKQGMGPMQIPVVGGMDRWLDAWMMDEWRADTESEDRPSTSATASALTSTGTSNMEFQTMLLQVSRWYDRCELTNMLKVLYKDKIKLGYLQRSKTTMDLFDLLVRAGHLKSTDLKVLIDTINVTDTRGVVKVSDVLRNAHDETNITAFSTHRQKLIQLGNVLSANDVTKLGYVYEMVRSEYEDQWTLILNLEIMGLICENQMQQFIEVLKGIEVHQAATMLEEQWMEQGGPERN